MRVLIACEFSGTVRDAFTRAGHSAISCDLLPSETPGEHYQGDIRDIIDGDFDLMIAHPVCTRLANAGVRWLNNPPPGKSVAQMWREFNDGVEFYKLFRDSKIPKKCIENPIFHKYARCALGSADRQIVQPWHFGDPFFKATGFELTGLPRLINTNRLTPPLKNTPEYKKWSAVHREPPGPNRQKNRSRTYPGIANAMAEQFGKL